MTTNAAGAFPGDAGSLPLGLTGPFFRVVQNEPRPYPEGQTLALGDRHIDGSNVFHWLGEMQRWLRSDFSFLPRRITDARVVAIVGLGNYSNACSLSLPATTGGDSYDHVLSFGRRSSKWYSRIPSVIVHERTHGLLNDLGLSSTAVATGGIHEGTADYMGALKLGTPKVYRDLSKLKVWPKDANSRNKRWGEVHAVGWIWGGALWDSRGAVGQHARAFDAAVLEGVSTLSEAWNGPRA